MDESKFWDKVEITNYCWNWAAATTRGNYGIFGTGNKLEIAHRVSYKLHKGEIPEGLVIDHLCSNTLCVNPAHLEAVTQKENVMRGIGIGSKNSKKTHCPQGHEYDEDNTYIDPRNRRRCIECGRIKSRQYKRINTKDG